MQKSCTDFLARTRFSLEKYRHIGGGDAFQFLTDCLHRGGAPKDYV
jgi:hypothetical protein